MLRPPGHVLSVATGEETVPMLTEQAVDVVVSDMGMGASINWLERAEVF